MGRLWSRPVAVAAVALCSFTAGLIAVSLPVELDDPAHYDGDDAGSIRKPVPPWPTVVGTDFSEPLAPALLVRRGPPAPPTDVPRDPDPVRLVSRARPARALRVFLKQPAGRTRPSPGHSTRTLAAVLRVRLGKGPICFHTHCAT